MPEERKVSVLSEEKTGKIRIADEVAAIIADLAIRDVKGILLPGHKGKRNYGRGFHITIDGNDITIDVSIMLKNGYKAKQVAIPIQQKIKAGIENMLDLNVKAVNVCIVGMQKERPAAEGTN